MLDWLDNADPLVRYLVYGGAALIALIIVGGLVRRLRESAATARRRAALRAARGDLESQHEEMRRLAAQIVATSSTGAIAGFVILRQIEAVFVEGHRSPAEAVEMLKAVAAGKGANALINLTSQRLPSGKCVASGDAVIVRPAGETAAPPPKPDTLAK